VGIFLPGIAASWQLYMGLFHPNFAAQVTTRGQVFFVTHFGRFLANFFLWRPALLLEYMAFFSLPLIGLLGIVSLTQLFRPGVKSWQTKNLVLIAGMGAIIIIAIATAYLTKTIPAFMPHLPWSFSVIQTILPLAALITLITIPGATIFFYAGLKRYTNSKTGGKSTPAHYLLDFTTLFLILLQFIYNQFGDEYLLGIFPLTLIMVVVYFQTWINQYRAILGGLCLIMLIVSVCWTHGLLAEKEAYWSASNLALSLTNDSRQVATIWTWASYHNFEDYIEYEATINSKPTGFDDLFSRWLPARRQKAQYVVTNQPTAPLNEKWQKVVAEFSYSDFLFQPRKIWLIFKSTDH
jgi:hypothetical protein